MHADPSEVPQSNQNRGKPSATLGGLAGHKRKQGSLGVNRCWQSKRQRNGHKSQPFSGAQHWIQIGRPREGEPDDQVCLSVLSLAGYWTIAPLVNAVSYTEEIQVSLLYSMHSRYLVSLPNLSAGIQTSCNLVMLAPQMAGQAGFVLEYRIKGGTYRSLQEWQPLIKAYYEW